MKASFLFILMITFTAMAQDIKYIKETKDYAGFNGPEKDMREETIYKSLSSTQKVKVGSKISIIKPYEVRELEVGGKYWKKKDPSTDEIRKKYNEMSELADLETMKY